jgi:hypothetical protein
MKQIYSFVVAVLLLLSALVTLPAVFAQSSSCPVPRLAVGNVGVVEFVPSVALRTEPETGQLLGAISTYYTVLDGPVCSPIGTLWWKVSIENGTVGYAPEGRGTTYWVYPMVIKVPITTAAAYQAFENGYMIWRYDAGSIDVFIGKDGGQTYSSYRNRFYAAMPDNPVVASPPAGLFRPINGFGKLWGNVASLRQQLGWAVAPEQSYMLTISRPEPAANAEYFTVPDGRSIRTYSHLVRYWSFQ